MVTLGEATFNTVTRGSVEMDYEIVEYSATFTPQLALLRSRLFGGSNVLNAEYLERKHELDTRLSNPFYNLAIADGQVVGMRGIYGSQL